MKHVEMFEKFETNTDLKKKINYKPINKAGYIKVAFMDNDPVKQRKEKFPRAYTTDTGFLQKFGEEIGAEMMWDDKSQHGPMYDNPITMYYVVFKTKVGDEINAIEKAEEFDFVIDADLYDEKQEVMSSIMTSIKDEVLELEDELTEISDEDCSKRIDELIKKLKELKEYSA